MPCACIDSLRSEGTPERQYEVFLNYNTLAVLNFVMGTDASQLSDNETKSCWKSWYVIRCTQHILPNDNTEVISSSERQPDSLVSHVRKHRNKNLRLQLL